MSSTERSQPSSPDEVSTVAFGSFPPSPAPEQHRLEVEKLLAVIQRGRAQEARHLSQLEAQAVELSQMRPQLQHHTLLCSQHENLLAQFRGLRSDHDWLSQEHLTVFSECQQQRGRLQHLEQETQHARQQIADQEAQAERSQSQLDTADLTSVELRIEKAAVQTLQNQLCAKQQADMEHQHRLRSLEAECANLQAINDDQQQQLQQSEQQNQELQQQFQASQEKLRASEEYGSSVLATLQEVRAVTQNLLHANGKVCLPLPSFTAGFDVLMHGIDQLTVPMQVLNDESATTSLKHVLREASSAASNSTSNHRKKKQGPRHSKPSAADRKPL